jgi:hypothetical protein
VATITASKDDIERWRENRQEEVDRASQYYAMVDAEPRTDVADVYRRLAAIEERHAAFWEPGELDWSGSPYSLW